MKNPITTLALCAALATAGCAHRGTPAPNPEPDPALLAELEGYETGAAAGLLRSSASASVIKWLGQLLLQAVTNTTVQLRITTHPPDSNAN